VSWDIVEMEGNCTTSTEAMTGYMPIGNGEMMTQHYCCHLSEEAVDP
jgi:hypothetical protein